MKFSAQNIDFNHPSFDLLGPANRSLKCGYPFKTHYHFIAFVTLYTDSPSGSTDAVARHVSFSQITCKINNVYKCWIKKAILFLLDI